MDAKFSIGDIVHHQLFDYRGVVIDVDTQFMLSEEWYDLMAKSRPPKDKPWYRVLVHNSNHETYVAEQNLGLDDSEEAIQHPDMDLYFEGIEKGRYQLKANRSN